MTDDEFELPEDEIDALVLNRAEDDFKASCVNVLDQVGRNLPYAKVSVRPQHQKTLSNLVNITQDLVARHVEGDVWIVSAMAQRASAQAKINSSIAVGMKRYWQGLASSTQFSGTTLQKCLDTIHLEITSCWNFNDPDDVGIFALNSLRSSYSTRMTSVRRFRSLLNLSLQRPRICLRGFRRVSILSTASLASGRL